MSTNPLHPPHPNHPPDIKPTVAPCGCFFDPRAGCRYTCDQHVVPLAVDMAAALHLADQSGSSAASNSMALTDAEWEILFAAESPPVKEVQPALDEEASTLPVLTIGPATLQPMPTASPPPPVNSHVNQPERQRTLQFRPPLPSTSALHSSPTGLVQAHHATSSPTAHSVTMSPGSDTSQSEGASEEDLGSEEDYDLVIGEPRPFQTAAEELLKMAPPTAGVLPPKQLDYLPPFPCHPVPKSHVIWVYIVRYKLIKHVVLLEPLDDRVCSLLSDLRWYSAELDFCQAQSNELIGFEAECWRNTVGCLWSGTEADRSRSLGRVTSHRRRRRRSSSTSCSCCTTPEVSC